MPTSMAAQSGPVSARTELNPGRLKLSQFKPEPVNFHARIRSETRAAHERVDNDMVVFDLKHPKSYADFLACHALALSQVRPSVRELDRPDIDEMIARLDADLRILGADAIMPGVGVGDLDGFGVAYVIRGSRMGARVLRPRIGVSLPTRYMDFAAKLPWRVFLAELEMYAVAGDDEHRARIVSGAMQTFAAFITAPEVSA